MVERVSIDDFDWSGSSSADAGTTPPLPADEPAPLRPPAPVDTPEPQRGGGVYGLDESKLPRAYIEYGRKNIYKRQQRPRSTPMSIDDVDWSGTGAGEPRTGGPAYNPADDYALTRGLKVGEQGGRQSMMSAIELGRIATLSPDEQRKAMIAHSNRARDPSEVQLQVPGIEDIPGEGILDTAGNALTFLGESGGQMLGSMIAAGEVGGLPGAVVGGGLGAAAGATALGAGALPGAGVGAVAGFTSGSLAAYGGMGVGGLFDDLMGDEGVKKGLADGSIDTDSLIKLTVGAGLAIGALDALPAGKAVSRVGGKEVAKDAVKLLLRKAIIKGALRGAKEEGTTEAVQGAISEITQAYEGGNINLAERALSVLNQGLVGAIGGAGPGVAGGVSENRQIPKPDDSLNQEFEIDYKTGAVKPSTRAAPTLPAGGGAPPASAAPHAPAGGFGQVPPQPAGAGARRTRAPVAPATVVQPGSVSPDIQAAATAASGAPPAAGQSVAAEPTAPQPAPRQGTGDVTIDAALTPTPAQKPAPAAAPEAAVAPPPQVPEAPPSTAYQPTPPENIAPTNVDMLQGLPNYGPEPAVVPQAPPPAAVQPPPTPAAVAPAAAAPAPALVEEPVVAPAPPPDLVSATALTAPLGKADRAKQRQEKRAQARQAQGEEERLARLADYADQLDLDEQADREDALIRARQLEGTPDYGRFHNALSVQMRRWLDSQLSEERRKAQERAQAAPPVRAELPAGIPAPRRSFKRPRPVVPKPVTAAPTLPVARPTTAKVTVRVTPDLYQRLAGAKGEEAAEARLVRTTVRHPKTRRRLGQVADIVRRQKEDVKTGAKTEERLFKLSFKKEPVSLEDLLGKYVVETTTEQERLPQAFARPARGYRLPPTPTPSVDRELPKKETLIKLPEKRQPKDIEAEVAERARFKHEAKMGPHAKNIYKRKPLRTSQLQQEVELRLPAALVQADVIGTEDYVEAETLREAAERGAASVSQAARKQKLTPFEAATKLFKQAIDKAIADYKAKKITLEEKTERELAEQERQAKRWQTIHRKAKFKAERVGRLKGMKAAPAVAGEARHTQRRRAYAQEKLAKGARDELLFKMAAQFRKAATFQYAQSPYGRKQVAAANAAIEKLQAQRVARAEAEDEAAVRAAEAEARTQALDIRKAETKERREIRAYLARKVREGEIEAAQAELLSHEESQNFLAKYRKRIDRALQTGPALRSVIAKANPPMAGRAVEARFRPGAELKPASAAKTRRWRKIRAGLADVIPASERKPFQRITHPEEIKHIPDAYMRRSREWATNFVERADKALARAKVALPTRTNQYFNTPEENGLIFIKESVEIPQGRSVAQHRADVNYRGANIHDALVAITFLQDMINAPDFIARAVAEKQLNGLIFTSSEKMSLARAETPLTLQETVEEVAPVRAERAAREEAAAAEEEARVAARLEQERNEFLAAKLRTARLFERKGYRVRIGERDETIESPVILPEGPVSPGAMAERPMGRPLESMTGAEALNRFTAKWRVLEGAPRGWRRWVRASLIRSLRQLVGDIDVHVVDGIYANNKAGLFVPGAKPKILINRAAMDRPALLADTIIHEMAHAATNYALHNNLRGTRDIVEALMRQLRSQIGNDISSLSTEIQNAFKNADEFVAAGIEHAPFQDMLASLAPTSALRAQVRALGRGRAMPNFWDQFVAMVENAIGFFTPAGTGGSYMSQLLKIYPNIAMTLGEQQRAPGVTPDVNDILEHPFDMANVQGVVTDTLARLGRRAGATVRRNLPTEELRRKVAEEFFGGEFDNVTKPLFDMLLQHPRLIEDAMREGDQQDTAIRDWVNQDRATNEPIASAMYETLTDAVTQDVDPRYAKNTWIKEDAAGRTKPPTQAHVRHAGKRKVLERLHAKWTSYPQELRDLMDKRIKLMAAQMETYERKFVANWLRMLEEKTNKPVTLPKGLSRDDAVQQIMSGLMSPALEKALGDNAESIGNFGRLTRKNRLYVPLFRAGEHFISGRLNIDAPAGAVKSKNDREQIQFTFADRQQMQDYIESIGASGEDRLIGQPKKVQVKVGKSRKLATHWRVTMQDRFMAMSDDPEYLAAESKRLTGTGEYEYVTDPAPLNKMATLKAGMPLQLERMMHNIDTMSGHSEEEKALAKSMLGNIYVQTQQGNRITKKLLRRKGTYGFTTSLDDMTTAFRTNNEMMSRQIVSMDRMPAITKAERNVAAYQGALARRPTDLAKLSAADQARITSNYGKQSDMTAEKFAADVKAIRSRIEGAMAPGGKFFGEQALASYLSVVTMNYLMSPMYFVMQSTGIPLQTFPRFVAEVAKRDGIVSAVSRAGQYLYHAGTEVGFLGNMTSSATEALMEGQHLIKGFKPRPDWLKYGRTVLRSKDYMSDLYARLRANGVANVEEKIKMLEQARLMNFIGQAGLDQPNLRLDVQKPGITNKFVRGIEQTTRIFRALQEGLEINNRAVPMIAYFNHFMDLGVDVEQAKAMAINKMVSEQTGYSKENWPGWLSNPLVSAAVMFKKFGAQQSINFYDSLIRAIPGIESNPEERRYARVQLASMTLMLAAVGGFVGNPLWEPLRMLMYLLSIFGLAPDDWNTAKTQGEQWLASLTGNELAEDIMYGATRELGIDMSNRVANDTLLFYQQPDTMTKDEWAKIIGYSTIGAPGQLLFNTGATLANITNPDQSWPKWLAALPIPKVMKDALKAYDIMENGPSTTTGVSTGPPTGLVSALLQSAGVRTREQARPFEQGSAAQHRAEQHTKDERAALMRSISNSGYGSAAARRLRDWNRSHPDRKERITMKNLHDARGRRRKLELEIRRKNLESM